MGAFVGDALPLSASVSFRAGAEVRLLPTSEFSLRLLDSPFSEEMPQSEVMSNGQPTGRGIDGAVLEAAIRWNDLVLAFVTDNITNQEALHISLFDAEFQVIDSAWLGSIYASDVFSLIKTCPPNTVRFRFLGTMDWTLDLLSEETFTLPYAFDPCGVRRPFGFHRRFRLHAKPAPNSF
jgi:hypothetical protein